MVGHHGPRRHAGADRAARRRGPRLPAFDREAVPVLSWYVVQDWREGCERCIQILRYGGMGHTMSIHSQNDDVILQFGLKKPAFRICVNTPTTHGSIGLTTGLDPAMTLGCGGWGGNSTSDNISPRHLLNIKRVAYGIRPAMASPGVGAPRAGVCPRPRAPCRPARLFRRPRRGPSCAESPRMSFGQRSIGSCRPEATDPEPTTQPANLARRNDRPQHRAPGSLHAWIPWRLSAKTTSGEPCRPAPRSCLAKRPS